MQSILIEAILFFVTTQLCWVFTAPAVKTYRLSRIKNTSPSDLVRGRLAFFTLQVSRAYQITFRCPVRFLLSFLEMSCVNCIDNIIEPSLNLSITNIITKAPIFARYWSMRQYSPPPPSRAINFAPTNSRLRLAVSS